MFVESLNLRMEKTIWTWYMGSAENLGNGLKEHTKNFKEYSHYEMRKTIKVLRVG